MEPMTELGTDMVNWAIDPAKVAMNRSLVETARAAHYMGSIVVELN